MDRDKITGKAYINILKVCRVGKSLHDVQATISKEFNESQKALQVSHTNTSQNNNSIKLLEKCK